jgi:hypothetical protein
MPVKDEEKVDVGTIPTGLSAGSKGADGAPARIMTTTAGDQYSR